MTPPFVNVIPNISRAHICLDPLSPQSHARQKSVCVCASGGMHLEPGLHKKSHRPIGFSAWFGLGHATNQSIFGAQHSHAHFLPTLESRGVCIALLLRLSFVYETFCMTHRTHLWLCGTITRGRNDREIKCEHEQRSVIECAWRDTGRRRTTSGGGETE